MRFFPSAIASHWDTHWPTYPGLQPLLTLPGFLHPKYFSWAFITNILCILPIQFYFLSLALECKFYKYRGFHLFCLHPFPLYLRECPTLNKYLFNEWMNLSVLLLFLPDVFSSFSFWNFYYSSSRSPG